MREKVAVGIPGLGFFQTCLTDRVGMVIARKSHGRPLNAVLVVFESGDPVYLHPDVIVWKLDSDDPALDDGSEVIS